ncbi:Frizzled-10-B [Eumeta japonica]|uniref:Frizzled-10-B n=1 Tax=Eumeta variegata TaxID=151549 RepID=A0A4C1WYA4_EUMVA|nr:Frizzled-10-B [Eumeta japonica]
MIEYAEVVSSGCSPHARFLLCSAFAPLCSEQVAGAVSACRALCERVAADCRLGALPCARLPHRADRRLCMRPPDAVDPSDAPDVPPPPAHAPLPVHARWPADGGCGPAHARAPTGECWPACGHAAAYSDSDKRRAELVSTVLAWVSLISTCFALLTFCAEPARYRYPERPAVWAAACHALVALAWVARSWLGARAVSCAGPTLAVDGLAAPACVGFFTLTYYCTLAADAWMANACVSWYLTAASEWSTEALERAAAYVHAAAWGWAGAWTAAALALRRVAGDELSGVCGVADAAAAALVGVPRGALLAAGLALGAGAWPGVARVRRALGGRGAVRVGRLAARAAAAGLLYILLAAAATVARVLEARARANNEGLALLAALESGSTEAIQSGVGANAWSSWLGLACGAAASAWAWSRKSAWVWRRALCPPRKAPCCSSPAPPLLRSSGPYYKRPVVSRV